ncbi:hypothetical protein [Nocardia aurea]|uniref:ESX-1 secretion-associated protein EspA/EspE-like domain-containing protein n=1 Tax=Nocardia aurea TaxID=2144174 RepID=A0ABV3G1X8_9NOCA
MIGATTRTEADRILDTGIGGLRYFEVFLPRYREWVGHTPAAGDYSTLVARYDQQRGMDLERFTAFATVLGEELQEIIDQAGVQTSRLAELPSRWNGSQAADSAEQFFAGVTRRTQADVEDLSSIQAIAASVIEELTQAVQFKADTIGSDFATEEAAGKSSEQIDWIIDCARGQARAPGSSIEERLATLLADYEPDTAAQQRCANWLNQVFVPEIDNKVEAFLAICDAADTEVASQYDQLITALNNLDPAEYTSPGGNPSSDTDLSYTAGQSQYSTVANQDPETAEPDDEHDMSTVPAAQKNSSLNLEDTSEDTSDDHKDEDEDDSDEDDEDQGDEDDGDEDDEDDSDEDEAATPGAWTPDDIATVVSAVGEITGTIPDMITAVGSLASGVGDLISATSDVISATGEATTAVITAVGESAAAVLDTVDDQPGVSEAPTDEVDTDPEDPPAETASEESPRSEESAEEPTEEADNEPVPETQEEEPEVADLADPSTEDPEPVVPREQDLEEVPDTAQPNASSNAALTGLTLTGLSATSQSATQRSRWDSETQLPTTSSDTPQ